MIRIRSSSFHQALVKLNRLDKQGFRHWVLLPGMEFGSRNPWWEENGKRPAPHEGLNFCCFADHSGRPVHLKEKTLVPAMHDGTVTRMIKDFLGVSILVRHGYYDREKSLYSISAPTVPLENLQAGSRVKAGEPLAAICATGKKGMRPHLHLSVAWADESAAATLEWQNINDSGHIGLCNPLDFLDRPCS